MDMDSPARNGEPRSLRCTVVRWLADEPQPGWVEARLRDANGCELSFFDKPPIFDDGTINITAATDFPIAAGLRVWLTGHRTRADGRRIAIVVTRDADASDGTYEFEVDDAAFW